VARRSEVDEVEVAAAASTAQAAARAARMQEKRLHSFLNCPV